MAPWAVGTAANKVEFSGPDFDAMFPILGAVPAVIKAQKEVPNAVFPPVVCLPVVGKAVIVKPVCLFAVFGRTKCRNTRKNRLCYYRHPEIVDDLVTNEEYVDARKKALKNIKRFVIKNGGKIPHDNLMAHNRPLWCKQPLIYADTAIEATVSSSSVVKMVDAVATKGVVVAVRPSSSVSLACNNVVAFFPSEGKLAGKPATIPRVSSMISTNNR